jgi:hypothetical protein
LVADATSKFNSWTRFRAANNTEDKARESNQLRYVCRQLYVETSSLSLLYNDLTFTPQINQTCATALKNFDQFVSNCAPIYLRDIRRITILDDSTEPPLTGVNRLDYLSPTLLGFCRAYPSTVVIVRFSWNNTMRHGYDEVECVAALSKALRNTVPFGTAIYERLMWPAWTLLTYFKNAECPDNLRFSCVWELDLHDTRNSLVLNGLVGEEWVEVARRLHENGV